MGVIYISSNDEKEINKKSVIFELNINDLNNKKTGLNLYNKLYDSIWNYIFLDYKRKDNFIKVVFPNEDKFVYLTVSETIFHLMFWRLHIVYNFLLKKKIEINSSDLYDLSVFDKKLLKKILEKNAYFILNYIDQRKNGIDELSFYISKIIDDFSELTNSYCAISSNTISIYEIKELEKRSKEFKECINTKLNESDSIKEIEMNIHEGSKKLIKSILDDGKSSFVYYINGKRMSIDQFTQMFYAVGPRADVDKTILPKIMKGNYFNGYSSPSDAYIDAITGRDAQILKYITVRESGYLSRKINIACLNTKINYDVKDCGTKHFILFNVESKDHLKMIDLKYMILPNGKLKLIRFENDKNLIGQTIKLRSHICCALKENEVCMTCFGEKAKRLIGTRIGGLPAIKFANPISQKLMRAKHFSGTNSVEVQSEYLEKYFNKENNKLYFKQEMKDKDIYIIVEREFVEEIAEGATSLEDESTDSFFPLESFTIRDGENEYVIECDGLFLVLTDEILEESKKFILEYDSDEALIPINKISNDIPIFNMVIVTEEVSRYLKKMKKLIDSSKTKSYNDISTLVMDIGNLLLEMGISSTSLINIETLVYQLIKDPIEEYKRADFTSDELKYSILPLSSSIQKSNIYTAFSFEKYKKQISDIDSFKKYGEGFFDSLFKINKPKYLKPVDKNMIENTLNRKIIN